MWENMNTIRNDLTTKKFGHLTVIELIGKTKRGQSIWKCLCDCGNHKDVRGYHLIGKKIRSCGCLKRETVNIKWNGFGKVARWVWNAVRIGAERRNIQFELTAEDMWNLALSQNMKCALTDTPLIFIQSPKHKKESNVSLDRIDSTQGYVIGNIQWVTKNINVAKQSMSQTEFIELCRSVVSKFGVVVQR